HADDQPAYSQRTPQSVGEIKITGPNRLSAASRCLRAGDDAHTEKAELCPAQSGQSTVDERPGSDCLHSGRGAQTAGALHYAHARWASERFAMSLSSHFYRSDLVFVS